MGKWLKDALERAAATAAEAALSVLGLDMLDVFKADWKMAVGVAAGGAVLSLLKSVAARKVGDPDSAAMMK